MSDQISSFESALETDMRALAAEIGKQRERPEMANAAEKDLIKEAIRAFPALPQTSAPQAGNSQVSSATTSRVLPDYAADAPAETKLEIEYLIELAFKEGLSKAFSESKKSPYFVQDAFHDALAGKLYPELQKRGMVK